MNSKVIIPVFCALALLMLNISVYGASFSLDASGIDGDINTCPTILSGTEPLNKDDMPILITNLHSASDTYAFNLDLPEGWSGEAVLGSSVASGETNQIFVWITVPDDEPGRYPVTLTTVSGMTGEEDTASFWVKLLNCHSADLVISEASKEVCQEDGTTNFNVAVTNKGNSEETFTLSVSENGQVVSFASLSDTEVTLGPGEGINVDLGVVVADLLGTRTLTVKADSTSSYADDTITATLDVLDCYGFDVSLQSDAGATCIGKPVEFTLSIVNSGETDTFEITSSAISSSESDFVSVAAGTEELVKIMVTPEALGANGFELSISSSKDSATRTVQGTVNVEECRDVAVIISPTKRIHCEGTVGEYQISVKNMGSLEDTFDITSTHGILSKSKVVAGPGETKFLKLTVDTKGMAGDNIVEIIASSEGAADYTSAELVVENCFTAELRMQPENVTTCPCGTAFFKIILRNTGQYSDVYLLKFGTFGENVELAGGQAIGFNFEYAVPCDMAGNYVISASATSATTGAEYGTTAELDVNEQDSCWSSKIEGSKHLAVETAKGLALPLTLSNTGEQPVTYTIVAVGPEWVYLEPASVELNTGEDNEVFLYVSPPTDTPVGEYPASVTAESEFTTSSMELTIYVVEDITQWQAPEPELTGTEDIDTEDTGEGEEVFDVGTENTTNGEADGSITGQFMNVIPAWKTIAVGIITIVIVLILVIRFAFLVKA